MKRGMSRTEAKDRLAEEEFTWDDLRKILLDVHPTLLGDAGKAPSRMNKSISLAVSFNIYWRCIREKTGPLPREFRAAASNLLREFGTSTAIAKDKKKPPRVAHQSLIDIHNDDAPTMKHWTRNNSKHRWESKDGQWLAYDDWSCGRITMMRPDKDTEDNPAWCEIYEFAKSQTAGRISNGRQ